MYCAKCGQQLPDDAAFCVKCGTKVTQSLNNQEVGDASNKDTTITKQNINQPNIIEESRIKHDNQLPSNSPTNKTNIIIRLVFILLFVISLLTIIEFIIILKELVDWGTALTDIVSGLTVTLIAATVGSFFMKGYFKQILFARRMAKMGFLSSDTDSQNKSEIEEMCKNASEIKMIYVSGIHYLKENKDVLLPAIKNREKNRENEGKSNALKIQFLCCNPTSPFLENIENMEKNYKDADGKPKPLRKEGEYIKDEIKKIVELYKDSGVEIRFYSTEYRLPFVLAEYPDGSKKAWLTVSLPPHKSKTAFVLRAEKEKSKRKSMEFFSDKSMEFFSDNIFDSIENTVLGTKGLDFVDMMEAHFKVIWENGSKSVDEVFKENGNEGKQI